MMKHNKKRNVGIIYEQLAQAFSEALVEKNQKKAVFVKKIIDDHYEKAGELFKEFKIFNALLKVNVSSDSLATNILKEAKIATVSLNKKKLKIEKSLLIKDINYTLNEENFYSRNVPGYRNLATVQNLMNLWCQNSKNDLQKVVEYENKVHGLLKEEKKNINVKQEFNPEVNPLVLKIMQEKFQKKYKRFLSKKQSLIIESYIGEDVSATKKLLKEVKMEVVKKAKMFESGCENQILLEKSGRVISKLSDLDENRIDDDSIAKFLLACKLCEQLEEKR
ncbi:MAG TPA: hypothetical protein EYG21_03145 [Nitrospinaceae bacterium]|nr:hypothetical protein [Nitrospinaceae bacterium]